MPSSDIYARVFENARVGILLLERATGRVLEVNTAFLRMAGRGRDDVVGRSFWEPPLIADAGAGAEVRDHLRAGGGVEGLQLPLETGNGRRQLLEVNGGPSGGLIQLEVQDATVREHARLAERMEALRLLAGRMAGEFQRLDHTLRMLGELLLANASQDRPVLRALEEVQQASERAGAIAGQLLAFSGKSQCQAREMVLNDLIKAMLPRLRQMFGPGIEIVDDLSPDLEPVMADPAQVRQIILSLADNSREAMGRGGTFYMQTRNAPASAGGPYAMLAIGDNGPGLDDESWAHMCEPFSSTKADGRGLGLGLAAVYGMVRQSGGRLWAYSQPGKGVTFRIYLPLAKADFPSLPELQAGVSASGATILLVQAHDGLRTVMANLLKKRGYRVLPVLHAEEALRVTEAQGLPDLLISRPEPELVRQLSQVAPQLRVLYLGGHASDPETDVQVLPPRTSLLPQPFEVETLLATVQKLLEG
jgi:two-component system, cell cycle sensor histidine kinase and response regulator CckA